MTTMETHARKVEAHLASWTAQIEGLASREADYGPNAKAEFQAQLDALRAQRAAVEKGLRDLRAAGPDSWQSYRASLDESCGSLEDALRPWAKKR